MTENDAFARLHAACVQLLEDALFKPIIEPLFAWIERLLG